MKGIIFFFKYKSGRKFQIYISAFSQYYSSEM